MTERFYLTTPIYYVNDVPHLGHAYTTIAADVVARFHRQRGREVFFLTGTDEHGQKVAQAAAKLGIPPREHVDRVHQRFKDAWAALGITHDAFIRTTDEGHVRVVQEALRRLHAAGHVYAKDYEGWYHVSDEIFVTDPVEIEKLREAGRVEHVRERNWFFRMGAFQERLIGAIEGGELDIRPESRRNEILGFLRKPLEDLSISRPKHRVPWGVELPFDPEHVCYVWVDALLNYVSALDYLAHAGSFDTKFAPWWPADLHLIGKDILTTHSVYWITLLMALELPLPKRIFSHGWWLVDGQKMSKSLGNVVDPVKLAEEFGVDALRYVLLREVTFGQDGDFSAKGITSRINSDLANGLGNLASRMVALIGRAGGTFAERPATSAVGLELEAELETAVTQFEEDLGQLRFAQALQGWWAIIDRTNQLVQATAPWELLKKADDPQARADFEALAAAVGAVLATTAVALQPILPERCAALWSALGLGDGLAGLRLPNGLQVVRPPAGTAVGPGASLFPRLDPSTVTSFAERAAAIERRGVPGTPKEAMIGIDDFSKVELRVGEVLAAERVPKSKKLLELQVGFGEEGGLPVRRQILAGIGLSYAPEDLVGKRVVAVFNLAPAQLMGRESQGMLLAADDGEGGVRVVTFDGDITLGSRVR
jgi:methionyl-tRNA synthetase